MSKSYLIALFFMSSIAFGQLEIMLPPKGFDTETRPVWDVSGDREAVDSCGAYFNNYVGLAKTTSIAFEGMRTGSGSDFTPYAGRAQRFHALQEIEISGIQFYAFQTNTTIDSLMVITLLYDYDAVDDTVGVELARDTVWVSHTAFTSLLPDIEINSYFDETITVDEDYIIAVITPTDDSLKIITNSALEGDGGGEGVSFAYYENPVAPSFTGWYATLPVFGPSYDIDYLLNPLVKYRLHNGFSLNNDTICPNIISAACTEYVQVPNFSDPHYNGLSLDPTSKIVWNWGDGYQNTGLTGLCHTYEESGEFEIVLIDTIRRHNYLNLFCAVEQTTMITVLDSTYAVSAESSTDGGLTIDFTGTATNADSVSWDFGDETTSIELNPTHTYDAIGSYSVWFYAYGPCNTDSTLVSVLADDVSISENELFFTFYPNPADETILISGYSNATKIEIISLLGEVVYQEKIGNESTLIHTEFLTAGTYLVRMSSDTFQGIRKLVVQH